MTIQRDLTNADDLAANQHGLITDAQRRAAARPTLWVRFKWLYMLVGLNLLPGTLQYFIDLPAGVRALTHTLLWSAAGAIIVWALVQWVVRWRAAAEGEVRQAEGVIVWRRTRYVAEFPGRARWADNRVRDLLPGPYRFYYLRRSGYVLSAERLAAVTVTADDLDMVNEALEQAVGFGADDIEHNRAGRLGPGEALRLAGAVVVLTGLVLPTGSMCAFLLWLIYGEYGSNGLLPLLIFGGAGFGLLAVAGRAGFDLGRDLLTGQIAYVDGLVQRISPGFGRFAAPGLRVAGAKYAVVPTAHEALIVGLDYRVYFLPHSKWLMAMEAIGVSDNSTGGWGAT